MNIYSAWLMQISISCLNKNQSQYFFLEKLLLTNKTNKAT